eukprot:TRINITY_DN114457_c0_g1_i1.p2 TRINITY_DN114457_c0_g1~~TRINITY_DN114457_c0_g1_i1.p2  ORF type:complete len:104 (+),score=7.55 TRINITY_DN114457_c0_g1_i1:152-463(+)
MKPRSTRSSSHASSLHQVLAVCLRHDGALLQQPSPHDCNVNKLPAMILPGVTHLYGALVCQLGQQYPPPSLLRGCGLAGAQTLRSLTVRAMAAGRSGESLHLD